MKLLLSIVLSVHFLVVFGQSKLKEIPRDLESLGVSSYFAPEEILRVWRFPEGGAAFEQMIEFSRTDTIWSVTKFTYLIDEYHNDKSLKELRQKTKITGKIVEHIPTFANGKLLHADVNNEKKQFCSCDLYRAEYRVGNQGNIFEFTLQENLVTNTSKQNLMTLLRTIYKDE